MLTTLPEIVARPGVTPWQLGSVEPAKQSNCLTKPMNTWKPTGPNSAKNGGSLAFTHASMTLVPSMVEVCCQPGPGGTAWMPYLPGARCLISTRPLASVRQPVPNVVTMGSPSGPGT